MERKAVLAIGLDPTFADLSAFPNLTSELMRDYIDTQVETLRAAGFDAVSTWIAPGATGETAVRQALEARRFDCILIGAGLREPPEHLLLFEAIVNLARRLAPHAPVCFNTNPTDTLEAVRRWIAP
jgi:hypothetical protein